MEAAGQANKGGICCNICYSLICLGFLIWGIVALVNIDGNKDPTGMWVMVLCMTCCFLCCCSAAVLAAGENQADQMEAMEMAMSGASYHKIYLHNLKKAPWKAVCGFSGVLSLIVLGVLGMVEVITNMPKDVALVSVIVGGSLLGYSICLMLFTICTAAAVSSATVNTMQDPAMRNEIANLEAMVADNNYSPPGAGGDAAKPAGETPAANE